MDEEKRLMEVMEGRRCLDGWVKVQTAIDQDTPFLDLPKEQIHLILNVALKANY